MMSNNNSLLRLSFTRGAHSSILPPSPTGGTHILEGVVGHILDEIRGDLQALLDFLKRMHGCRQILIDLLKKLLNIDWSGFLEWMSLHRQILIDLLKRLLLSISSSSLNWEAIYLLLQLIRLLVVVERLVVMGGIVAINTPGGSSEQGEGEHKPTPPDKNGGKKGEHPPEGETPPAVPPRHPLPPPIPRRAPIFNLRTASPHQPHPYYTRSSTPGGRGPSR